MATIKEEKIMATIKEEKIMATTKEEKIMATTKEEKIMATTPVKMTRQEGVVFTDRVVEATKESGKRCGATPFELFERRVQVADELAEQGDGRVPQDIVYLLMNATLNEQAFCHGADGL